MSGIIEIWRDIKGNTLLPTRFVIGSPPMMADGTAAPDTPNVTKIDFRETGAIAGKRWDRPVFCISFEDSFIQRFVFANTLVELAYETKAAEAPKTPQLPE
jgi:hypothetical protein